MIKSKEENKPVSVTTERITNLAEEVKSLLEKITGKKLLVEICKEKNEELFWRISKEKELRGIICTIYYDSSEKELVFWRTHENYSLEKSSEYDELSRKLQEFSQKFGLNLKDLSKHK